MIIIEDFCNHLKPHEIDVMTCYARLVMEYLLTKEHKFTIRIFVKNKSEAIYPESGGFCYWFRTHPDIYDIVLFQDDVGVLIKVLTHELIHVKQYIEDGFLVDSEENKVFWQGEFYMTATELVRLLKEKQEIDYTTLPWEDEANERLKEVVNSCSMALDELVQYDPTWHEFLEFCKTEKSYKNLLHR